ncbi:MAG TPA: response regulator [Alphaproteobacteria bacterium]|nr:response regulator [Alphaproteobacteria bacterium]
MADRPLVAVVDDDESVRESLPPLLRELGYRVEAFASASEFLASEIIGKTKCLVLDITMPGMSGLDLQRELRARRHDIPIIFITANGGDSPTRVIEQGAVACLLKPFSDVALLEALETVFS